MAEDACKSGFYLGAGGGYSTMMGKNDIVGLGKKLKYEGFIGGLFAGYDFAINNRFSVGLEAGFDANFDNKKVRNKAKDYDFKTQKSESFKISVKPTYKLDKFHMYLNVGFINTKFSLSKAHVQGNTVGNFKSIGTERINGLELGAGFKVPFGKLSLGGEYNYGIYENQEKFKDTKVNFKPRTHDFRVRVAYAF